MRGGGGGGTGGGGVWGGRLTHPLLEYILAAPSELRKRRPAEALDRSELSGTEPYNEDAPPPLWKERRRIDSRDARNIPG